MLANAKGELAVAVPHQDVLILRISRTRPDTIYWHNDDEVFAEGRIPITSLPFIYEDKTLEPVFILAKTGRKINRIATTRKD